MLPLVGKDWLQKQWTNWLRTYSKFSVEAMYALKFLLDFFKANVYPFPNLVECGLNIAAFCLLVIAYAFPILVVIELGILRFEVPNCFPVLGSACLDPNLVECSLGFPTVRCVISIW